MEKITAEQFLNSQGINNPTITIERNGNRIYVMLSEIMDCYAESTPQSDNRRLVSELSYFVNCIKTGEKIDTADAEILIQKHQS